MVMKNISIKPKLDNTMCFLSFQAFLQLLPLVFHLGYGILMSLAFISWLLSGRPTDIVPVVLWALSALIGYVGFAVGLTSGIHLLKRINFGFSLSSICFLLISSLIFIPTSLISLQVGSMGMVLVLCAGLPMLTLSVLSIIFTSISKGEFA